MIKACIFDMDGTVADTLESIAYFANKALVKYGLPPIETQKYKELIGNGAELLVRRMIDTVGGNEEEFKKVKEYYKTTYDHNFLYLTVPYDGMIDTLTEIKKMSIQTAILSNKPNSTTKKISDSLFGNKLIDICYGARDSKYLKPHPEVVFEILNEMGVEKNECIFIGDTATDMQTAKNAGLFSIGVLWGFRNEDELVASGADELVAYPKQIIEVINNINKMG